MPRRLFAFAGIGCREQGLQASIGLWVGFNAGVIALLALDLGLLHRRSQEIRTRAALLQSGGYVLLSLLFAGTLGWLEGGDVAAAFLAGYLIEKSLSLDNIFVISLLFGALSVPREERYHVLFWGVLGAMVMRGSLILAGIGLINAFSWMLYLFGAFLVLTGVRMLWSGGEAGDLEDKRIYRFLRGRAWISRSYDGSRFFSRKEGVWKGTPLLLALLMVETTDLIFALDSIPAVFGVTRDAFIVYASNIMAVLGLRALFFALAGIVRRFRYLKHGLSLLLVLIGLKLLVEDLWKVPTWLALLATAAIIGGSMGISLLRGGAPREGAGDAPTSAKA